ncbi:hypothetical protein JX266_005875 [Neoarthrinium moseri]|nr:hypothetical protein JX266_005875 [Neoarthrinium moseri]
MAETGRSSGGDLASRDEPSTTTSHQTSKSPEAVEMDTLPPKPDSNPQDSPAAGAETKTSAHDADADASQIPPPDKTGSLGASQPSASDAATPAAPSAKAMGKAPATASEPAEQDAIGPADSHQEPASSGELAVDILLILPQTGNRHPFRINERYLKKRNVNVTGVTEDGKMDPFSITVYTLKELILREWRKDWDTPPREPTSIRLIKMGKMLDDKLPLNQYDFTPTVKSIVHMTVKPQEIIDEEEANKRLKEPGSHTGRSGCCVIL